MRDPIELYPFQKDGVAFLQKTPRCLLGDDMGLGKTVQVLAALPEGHRTLIVCSRSVVSVWVEHLDWIRPDDNYIVLGGSRVQREEQLYRSSINPVTLTSYELFVRHAEVLRGINFTHLVLDEAHKIKNRKSRRAGVAVNCPIEHKWLLTGTPIHLHPHDAYMLLRTIDPQKYKAFWKFVNKHCYVHNNGFGWIVEGCRDEEAFAKLFDRIALRRLKVDCCKQLPEKIYTSAKLPMSPAQSKVYALVAAALTSRFATMDIEDRRALVLSSCVTLRQAALDPQLTPEGVRPKKVEVPPKAEYIIDYVESCDPQKVVVFSFFRKWLFRLQAYLNDVGVATAMIIGGQTENQRAGALKAFRQDEQLRVLLVSIRAGGEGLNLQCARHAIFTDLDYNPNVNLQAEDRLHRIGIRTNPCIVHLSAERTIEQSISRSVRKKEVLTGAITEIITSMSRGLLQQLIQGEL